jgi:hypothetical protein
MGLPDIGITLTHKVLHHKRPQVFPLLDRLTAARIRAAGGHQLWSFVHAELVCQPDRFAELERWFAAEARRRQGEGLTRLRIHDIVLWCEASGQFAAAKERGEELA